MNKEMFEMATATTTVEGTPEYQASVEAINEEMDTLNANTDLTDIHSIAIAALALSCATSPRNIDGIEHLNECVEKAIGRYAAVSELQAWRTAKESPEGPMHYACKTFFYPVIRVKEKRHPKIKTLVLRSIELDQKQIDLIGLHNWVKGNDPNGGIGAKTSWLALAKSLNWKMSGEAAYSIGDKHNVNRVSNPANLKDPSVALANFVTEDLITQFDEVVKAMIGEEYTAIDFSSEVPLKDWNLIYRTYMTVDKKSNTKVKFAKDATLVGILQRICGRILHDESGYQAIIPIAATEK